MTDASSGTNVEPKAGTEASPDTAAMPDQYAQAVDRYRKSAVWIITTFGVIAGALLTSVPLSNLSKSAHLTRSIVGVAIAMIGVGVAVLGTATILAVRSVSVEDLRDDTQLSQTLSKHASWLSGYNSIGALIDDYKQAAHDRVVEYEAGIAASFEGNAAARDAADIRRQINESKLTFVRPAIDRILGIVLLERYRHAWRSTILSIGIGIILAATGILLFAAQGTMPDAPTTALSPRPVRAVVALDQAERKVLASEIGASCGSSPFEAIILSADDSGWSLIPTASECASVEVAIPRAEATVTAVVAVCPPVLGPTPAPIAPPSPGAPPTAPLRC